MGGPLGPPAFCSVSSIQSGHKHMGPSPKKYWFSPRKDWNYLVTGKTNRFSQKI
jgi:hypothetical protein